MRRLLADERQMRDKSFGISLMIGQRHSAKPMHFEVQKSRLRHPVLLGAVTGQTAPVEADFSYGSELMNGPFL